MAAAAFFDQVQQIFIAYYGRPADPAGQAFWAGEIDKANGDLSSVINAFGNSEEANTLFGTMTNEEKINALYQQMFGRDAEAEGLNFYAGELLAGRLTQASIMLDILNGATSGTDKTAVDNKLAAANDFTTKLDTTDEIVAYAGNEAANAARNFLDSVTDDAATLTASTTGADTTIAAIVADSSNSSTAVNLTAATDVVSGNVINAGLVFNPGGTDRVNSLQDEDELTGTGPSPVLNATLGNANDNGGTIITPKINNIDKINVEFTGSGTGLQGNSAVTDLDVQDAESLTEVNIERVTSATDVARIENIQSVLTTMSAANTQANNAGTLEFSFGTNVLKGDNTGALNLSNVDVNNLNIGQNTSGTGVSGVSGQGYETLNLSSNGNANTIGTLNIPMDTNTSGVLNITGSADLTLAAVGSVTSIAPITILPNVEATTYAGGIGFAGGRISSIDASTFTGKLTINLDNVFAVGKADTSGTAQDVTVTGGTADDVFILQEAIQEGDKIDGGAGSDTIIFSNGSSIASNAVSIENARFEANNSTATADFDNLTDVTSVAVRNISNDTIEGTEGNAVFNLNDLNTVQAVAISVEHATTGATSITDTTVIADIADASGSGDSVTTIIADNVNTDPRFNYTLNADGAEGSTDSTNAKGRVENITIDDRDSESNSIELENFADRTAAEKAATGEVAGVITLTGGVTGDFINLDVDTAIADAAADTGATTGLYQYDISGGATDGDGYLDVASLATQVRIITATVDATGNIGNTIVRVGNTDGDIQNQTINLGVGDDTVIFDSLQDSTAGLTIADTVLGGAGHDKLALDGDNAPLDPSGIRAINLGASEWTHVSGIDEIVLVGNGVNTRAASPASVTQDKAGYNLILTNDLIDSTDAGTTIAITNDSGEKLVATTYESTATIDARALNTANNFTYDGEENSTAGTISAGATSDVFMFNDVTLNGTHIIDGGDENVQALNQNSDVIEVWNTAVVTQGDLANITNVGAISFRSDSAAPQTLTLRLTDAILDNFDNSQKSTIQNPETISLSAVAEATGIGQKIINLDLSEVTQGLYVFDTTGIADAVFNATTPGSSVELNVTSNGDQAEGLAKLTFNPNADVVATHTLAANAADTDEGTDAVFNLTTTNVADGTVLNYTVAGTGITAADFGSNSLTGTVTVTNNVGTITLPVANDVTTEGSETMTVSIDTTTATADMLINDTSVSDTTVIEVGKDSKDVSADAKKAEVFSFDVAAALATPDNTQVALSGFDIAADKLQIDLITADKALTTLDQLNGVEGIAVQQSIANGGQTIINFGADADGTVVAVTLAGITDPSTVVIEVI